MIRDVRSLAWLLERVRWCGLRVERQGPATFHRGAWQPDPRPWALADTWPEHPTAPGLSAPIDSDDVRCWIMDAACDELTKIQSRRRWVEWSTRADEYCDPWLRLTRLGEALDMLRPTLALVDAAVAALAAEAGVPVAAPLVGSVPLDRAAEALLWPLDALRRVVRRGEVRSVRRGKRIEIPAEEIARLLGLEAAGVEPEDPGVAADKAIARARASRGASTIRGR